MASLLAKRLSSFHHCRYHHHPHHPHHLAIFRLFLSTQTEQQNSIPFIAQYLISSFGFSMDRALKLSASKQLAPIKTPVRPDSVTQFFKRNGFSDTQIKSLISFQPNLICSSVEKTLEPRAHELMAAGFTGEILVQLIMLNPLALNLKNTLPRLQFWRNFVGNNDEVLLKVIKRNGLLMCQDIDTRWVSKFNLLQEYGLSQQDITKVLIRGCRFISQSPESIKKILERTEDLGFQRGSPSFCRAIRVVGAFNKESWDKRFDFYRSTFGWSDEDILSAFKKFPPFFSLSNENVKTKMDFFMGEAGIDPKSLVSQPVIFARSLEKSLVPRNCVLRILKEKSLIRKANLSTVCSLSEESFVKKFVEPYKEKVPELAKVYLDAYNAGNVTV